MIKRRIEDLITRSGMRTRLAQDVVRSFGLNAASGIISLGVAVCLARVLGASGYGIYAFAWAFVMLLAMPAQAGLPMLVVRETARAIVAQDPGRVRGIWTWSARVTLAVSVAVAVIVAMTAAWRHAGPLGPQALTLAWALALVPLVALGNLRCAALRGLGRIVAGQLPELVLRPALFLALLVCTALAVDELTPVLAMALHVAAAAAALIAGAWLLARVTPPQIRTAAPVYAYRSWLSSTLPLALLAGMLVVNQNTDVLMLGFFVPSDEVGVYRVAAHLALMGAFGLSTVNMVVGTRFAQLHVGGDTVQLQRVVTRSAQVVFVFTGAVVLTFILVGEPLLAVVFGAEYTGAHVPLLILLAGQFVNAVCGPVGYLLNMTGHERVTAKGVAVAALLNVVLNLMLIPTWGMNGAAVATAVSLVTWNLILLRAVRDRLGINSLAFGPRSGRT